ncbi:hypothetical protein [Streptomyces sp. NPDC093261]|uniref:hypothetical protein n=1 Tax=Streptomyces sp. NPDC093261 TaxID=3366037 RepID=UPI0037F19286
MAAPQPGDFGLVNINGAAGTLIRIGQWLDGKGFRQYEHAFIVTEAETPEHPGMVGAIAAFPGGARHVLYPVDGPHMLYSSGHIPLTDEQRAAIVHWATYYLGTPYSAADYFAIAAHHLHLPGSALLKDYVADTGHMICSQLVDRCYQEAGVRLFADGRWPGFVVPADLANLILTGGPR